MLQLTSGDQDLWAYARSVEREHGEGAFLYAAMKADRYEARGMRQAAGVWRNVLKRIEVRNGFMRPCQLTLSPQLNPLAMATVS